MSERHQNLLGRQVASSVAQCVEDKRGHVELWLCRGSPAMPLGFPVVLQENVSGAREMTQQFSACSCKVLEFGSQCQQGCGFLTTTCNSSCGGIQYLWPVWALAKVVTELW